MRTMVALLAIPLSYLWRAISQGLKCLIDQLEGLLATFGGTCSARFFSKFDLLQSGMLVDQHIVQGRWRREKNEQVKG